MGKKLVIDWKTLTWGIVAEAKNPKALVVYKPIPFRRVKKKAPNAMIIVERTRKRIFRYVSEKCIPSDSFEKDFKGKWIHVLGCDLMGKLWPLEMPPVVEGRMPTDLFMAKHCAEEVNEVYGLSNPLTEKIKLGILVGLCIAILIVIFLIATSQGGAHA